MKDPILSTRSNYPLNTRDIIPSDIELPKQPFDQQLVEDYILDEEQQAPRYFDQNRPFMTDAPTYWESEQNEDAQKHFEKAINIVTDYSKAHFHLAMLLKETEWSKANLPQKLDEYKNRTD